MSKTDWRNSVIVMGLLTALFTAVYKSMDNASVHNVFIAQDRLTAAFAYLIVGGWTGAILGIVLALSLGQKLIDPDFKGLVIRNKQMHITALISGGLSAVSTLFLLLGNQFGDPGALVALGSGVLVFTVAYDLWEGNVAWQRIALPILAAIIGGSFAAFSGSLAFTLAGVLFVLVISNGITAISEIAEQKGTQASDAVSLFVWRFFWLAITGTVLAIAVSITRGYLDLLLTTIQQGLSFLWFVIITMFFVFLGIGLKLMLKAKNAVSVVLLILSVQVALAFPITYLGDLIHSELFGPIPHDQVVWGIRISGAALLVWGIFLLRRTWVKTSRNKS